MVLARMISASTPRTSVLEWAGDAVAVRQADSDSIDDQLDGIRWELYPRVGAVLAARAFVIRLRKLSRRPKTVDAYARNLERFLACFTELPAQLWLEADEGDLLTYLDDLRHGRIPGIGAGLKRALPQNVVPLAGSRIAEATVAQHVVTLRQFYEYLIRARLRSDPINPVLRGGGRRTGETVQRGFIHRRGRLPWVAPAEVWDRILLHVITHETSRNRAMVLVAYDGALRREELVSLRLDDYDRHRALLKVRAETSKSGRDRWVPLSPTGQRVLDYYLDHERRALVDVLVLDESGPLFISESTRNPGRPLRPGAFNDVVEVLRTTLELPQLHPHTFRHQRLTALKAAGVPLEDIALFAGHVSTETTRLYLHLAPVELGAKIRAATAGLDAHVDQLIQQQLNRVDGR
jgi:integrase/recombinase XerD